MPYWLCGRFQSRSLKDAAFNFFCLAKRAKDSVARKYSQNFQNPETTSLAFCSRPGRWRSATVVVYLVYYVIMTFRNPFFASAGFQWLLQTNLASLWTAFRRMRKSALEATFVFLLKCWPFYKQYIIFYIYTVYQSCARASKVLRLRYAATLRRLEKTERIDGSTGQCLKSSEAPSGGQTCLTRFRFFRDSYEQHICQRNGRTEQTFFGKFTPSNFKLEALLFH